MTIHEALKTVIDSQKHYRLREAQDRARAEDLNSRVSYWSIGETIALFVVSFSQVLLLKASSQRNGPLAGRSTPSWGALLPSPLHPGTEQPPWASGSCGLVGVPQGGSPVTSHSNQMLGPCPPAAGAHRAQLAGDIELPYMCNSECRKGLTRQGLPAVGAGRPPSSGLASRRNPKCPGLQGTAQGSLFAP